MQTHCWRPVLGALVLAAAGAAQANLVVNGGFETGDLGGWSRFGTLDGLSGVDDVDPHTGRFAFYGGSTGSVGGISQRLATQAGVAYEVSFWLGNPVGGTGTSLSFDWAGGGVELSLQDAAAFAYTPYRFTLQASGADTELRFGFRHDPDYWSLDDVSVVALPAVPEPASTALLGLGLAALAWSRHRTRR